MEKLISVLTEELEKGVNISIINLIDQLILGAFNSGASDIHINPSPVNIRVRFRIDGILEEVLHLPKNVHPEIVSRIKILSQLRTDEHSSPQDGHFRYKIDGSTENLDVRVAIMPTYHGENIVLRLLVDNYSDLTLENLGFNKDDLTKIIYSIQKNSGMVLITGPTGSGKTTTLYSLIKILNSKESSIVTLEDPIEYAIENIEQIQINLRTGLTFANGLRSVLRQDPDIIMLGEIRDSETANIAVNTSLTGHLLLSTLHTNDAPTALPRLLDMKVEPFLVASTVNIIIAQRLVRKICNNCKSSREFRDEEMLRIVEICPGLNLKGKKYYYGKGCKDCGLSGFKGRTIVGEVLFVDEDIRNSILKKESAKYIKVVAEKNGMTSMLRDGFNKACNGITTFEEVLRNVSE